MLATYTEAEVKTPVLEDKYRRLVEQYELQAVA
jgi:hypothetical protein